MHFETLFGYITFQSKPFKEEGKQIRITPVGFDQCQMNGIRGNVLMVLSDDGQIPVTKAP